MKILKKFLLYSVLIILAILITVFSVKVPFTLTFKTITYIEEAPLPAPTTCEEENKDPNMINLSPKYGGCVYSPAGLPFSYTEVQTTKFCGSFSDLREFVLKDFLIKVFWFLTDLVFWFLVLLKVSNTIQLRKARILSDDYRVVSYQKRNIIKRFINKFGFKTLLPLIAFLLLAIMIIIYFSLNYLPLDNTWFGQTSKDCRPRHCEAWELCPKCVETRNDLYIYYSMFRIIEIVFFFTSFVYINQVFGFVLSFIFYFFLGWIIDKIIEHNRQKNNPTSEGI